MSKINSTDVTIGGIIISAEYAEKLRMEIPKKFSETSPTTKTKCGTPCLCWTGFVNEFGYGRKGAMNKLHLIHRLWYVLNGGIIGDGMEVLHECDNPPCCNLLHLFVGTHTDNIRDMDRKGRRKSTRGVDSGMAKLDDEKIRSIRRMLGDGLTGHEIANYFGVVPQLISQIKNNKIWRHVV